MRWAGGGPPYSKLGGGRGGSVRYKVDDLRAWFDGKKISNTSQVLEAESGKRRRARDVTF
jgi:hypothetical protein